MRIAVVTDTYPPQVNGVARTLIRTTDAMRARGHEVIVLAPADPGAAEDSRIHRFRSRVFQMYPELRAAYPGARAIARVFRDWRPDVVHIATPFGIGLSGRRAAKRLRIPLMSSYHTSFSQYAALYGLGVLAAPGWTFLRWFHNGTSLTLCPTHAIRDELVEHGFHDVDIWTRGVDAHQFNPRWRSIALRASWGADDDTTVITYVGRLAAEKGLDVALTAMRTIAAERSDVRFVIAGEGPLASYCRDHAPDGTAFAGQLSATTLSETYASSDVFLFPSTTDTFGNVALEAMASGLVVVGADVPQTREVVPSDCGVFFRPNDGDAMAIAVRRLLERPDDVAAKRRAAVASANSRGWEAIFDRLESDYERVAALRPTSRGSFARSSLTPSSP